MVPYKGRIYKYIDSKGAIDSLKKGDILFKNPKYLNDPFDCYSGLLEIKDLNKYVDYLLSLEKPNWNFEKRKKAKSGLMANYKKNTKALFFEKERDFVRIASFSKYNNSTLMWSHYSGSHSGLTIGYEIPRGFLPYKGHKHPAFLYEVDYMEIIDTIKISPDDPYYILKWVMTKSFEWKHEKEVRLVHLNDFKDDNIKFIKYNPTIVKKITFGVNTANKDIDEVLSILRNNYDLKNIKLTKMVIGKSLFTIEEIPFDS